MSDPGSVERNVVLNDIALQRAQQRNGGQVPANPAPADNLTGADYTPSRAVGESVPHVGSNSQATPTKDASLSWGRAGAVETNSERNAEQMGEEARRATGLAPQPIPGGVSPMPSDLGRRVVPDTSHSAGTWNANDIFSNTKIG